MAKHITGNDILSVRQLYSEQTTLEMQATIIICCNDIMQPSKDDGGIARRNRMIHFDQKFVVNPNEEFGHEHEIDPNLDEKLVRWAPALMWILVQQRRIFPDDTIKECPEVLRFTQSVREENDQVSAFETKYLHTPTERDVRRNNYATFSQLHSKYKHFCTLEKITPLPKHALRMRLSDRYRRINQYVTKSRELFCGNISRLTQNFTNNCRENDEGDIVFAVSINDLDGNVEEEAEEEF